MRSRYLLKMKYMQVQMKKRLTSLKLCFLRITFVVFYKEVVFLRKNNKKLAEELKIYFIYVASFSSTFYFLD